MPASRMSEFRRTVFTGASWMVAVRTLDRSLGLISTMILARLLVPADFGLVAMATSVLGLLEMISAFGFDVALIRHASSDRTHYDTAWTLNALLGLAVGVVHNGRATPVRAPAVDRDAGA